ncbi:nuclease-related domain-containing protein [Paraliobacillus salinarum]|uniref:nuclease-related domain-containing protein n=1 Tax=Paraliobacillus salinarum TaxID=1158996 RepID=UPI0015F5EB39|nr:nuclease-related domain-containing protein [Paraliobacillus salinarum]
MTKPLKLLELEALLPRLHRDSEHYDYIEELLRKEHAGHQGELNLNYFFHLIEISESILLNGLRLPTSNNAFQLDALLLTPNAHYLIEAKNIKGTITFNEAKQLIRTIDGIDEVFKNPQLQVNEQVIHLKKFLHEHNFPQVPIHPIVCFTHPKAQLHVDKTHSGIVTSEQLPNLIRELSRHATKPVLKSEELRELAHTLDRHHTDYRLHFTQKYPFVSGHIRNGVWCTSCKKTMMKRDQRTWICKGCGAKDKLAHKQALIEYALIYKDYIRNSEARDFLRVQSTSTVKRLLTGLELPASGENKARVYSLRKLLLE